MSGNPAMQRLLLRLTGLIVRFYYRESRFGGDVPSEGPVLLVGNHPNGLVDPVVVAGATSRPVRFLGKAPLFDMPVVGAIVRGMKTVPVYRKKDGFDTSKNVEAFAAVYDALDEGDLICIFPEGISHDEPELQELRTGAARMALGAEARRGFELGVRIVPVGLVYRAKRRFRSRVATWIGAPIHAAELAELHARDERAAVQELTARIAAGLSEVMVSLDRWEDLPLVELAESIWRPREGDKLERLQAFAKGLRILRERDPAAVDALSDRVSSFGERLGRLGLTPGELDVSYTPPGVLRFVLRNLLVTALILPLGLAGVVVWFVPYRAVPLIARLYRPSRDVHATVQILTGMLLFPLWWVVASALAWVWLGWLAGVLFLLVSPLLGLLAHWLIDWRMETRDDVEAFLRIGLRRELHALLVRERDAIAEGIEALRKRL